MVAFDRLHELRAEIDRVRSLGLLGQDIDREYLREFQFEAPGSVPEAKAVVVVASPQPSLRVTFERGRKHRKVLVPPTYAYDTDGMVHDRLNELLSSEGYRVEKVVLPVKLLATRSGLAKYGRNNITFVENMGSYFRITAYVTDTPLSEECWQRPLMLERCRECVACLNKCPTGAISADRFLLHAEKCLTFHNERADSFPDWIDPDWHRCLIGCMVCQHTCPENKTFVRWAVDTVTFSDEETEQILRGVEQESLSGETAGKLQQINLLKEYRVLPRNLSALIGKSRRA